MSTQRLRRFRIMIAVAYDLSSWLAAAGLAAVLRYAPGATPWRATVALAVALALTYLVLVALVRVAKGRATTGSVDDILEIGSIAVVAGVIVSAVNADLFVIARSGPIGATMCFLPLASFGHDTP